MPKTKSTLITFVPNFCTPSNMYCHDFWKKIAAPPYTDVDFSYQCLNTKAYWAHIKLSTLYQYPLHCTSNTLSRILCSRGLSTLWSRFNGGKDFWWMVTSHKSYCVKNNNLISHRSFTWDTLEMVLLLRCSIYYNSL